MTSYPYLPEQVSFNRRQATNGRAGYRPARRIAIDMRRRREHHQSPW